jgi:hypothetical protein
LSYYIIYITNKTKGEGCDYYTLAYTQLSNQQWELNENFERDAKTPQRVIEIIKEHLFTSYALEEKEIA